MTKRKKFDTKKLVDIAWGNYRDSDSLTDKKYWFSEICKLGGFYKKQAQDGSLAEDKQREIIAEEVRKYYEVRNDPKNTEGVQGSEQDGEESGGVQDEETSDQAISPSGILQE